jgi:hypothetical protein
MAGSDHDAALAQISVGILTWKRPSTLRYALKSYAKAGLLEKWGEVILFANASDPREVAMAGEFGLKLLQSPDNIGIGPAFAALASAAICPNFLFLENDWPCIENATTAQRRLTQGVEMLKDGVVQTVRYRHRAKYGRPLYSRNRCEGHELTPANRPHILDAVHWRHSPEIDFPDHITRQQIGPEPWYVASAAHAAYTNNPSLYRTVFAQTQIAPRSAAPGVGSEAELQDWWQHQPLTVAMGEGVFAHRDPGKEWRRARSIISSWFRRG